MGSTYGGVLALVAFGITVARGSMHGGGAESTLKMAILLLFVFGGIGFLIGRTAEWTVEDALRWRLRSEINARDGSAVIQK